MPKILSAFVERDDKLPVVVVLWCTRCAKTRAPGRGKTRAEAYTAAVAAAEKCRWRLVSRTDQRCPNCTRD